MSKVIRLGSWWLLGTAEMFVVCWCCLRRMNFSSSVTPHCTTQGEIIWAKANACNPVWARVGLIQNPFLSKGLIKTHIRQEEATFGLVTAHRTGGCGELGRGRAWPLPGVFWFCSAGATEESQQSSTTEC